MGDAPRDTQLVETGFEGIVALQGPMGLSDGWTEPIRPYQLHGGASFRQCEPSAHLRQAVIGRETPVATIGSCFAVEIHSWLVEQEYTVVECEHGAERTTSARFGNVYTTAQLRQCFERAYGQFKPVERWWPWRGLVVEPYRARMGWHTEAEAEASLANHLDAVRRVVETAEVLICTVGLSETFRNRADLAAYWRQPLTYDPQYHEFHRLDPAENLQNLEQIYALLRTHNPSLQLVITLSPVPLNLTFADESLAVADSYSKASLRVALHEFCERHPEVVYFPAYEMVRDLEIDPWQADRRHVKPPVVQRIMQRFMATLGAATPDPGKSDMPDYTSLYHDYWSRADRWETHSFGDVEALADEVLKLGTGPVLDVGCGMGLLVTTLRERGIDARGLDVATRTIEQANRRTPGCFEVGSILDIPHPDDRFDTVVCLDVLEHLDESDVPLALAELHRVTRRSALATIATRPDRDGVWHLTVRDRSWWRQRLLDAGFGDHPKAADLAAYEEKECRRLGIDASGLWVAVVAKSPRV